MNNTKNSTQKSVTKKPKAIKSPKAAEEHCDLESPTSVKMKQSFLLKQSDKEFENYWNYVKKKKEGHPAVAQAFGLQPTSDANKGNIKKGSKPAARDGHSANIYKDMMVIFGGDRHQMPFNDMFILNLEGELQK